MELKEHEGMLFVFPDAHDPYTTIATRAVRPGPIMQLLQSYTFKHIVIFALPFFSETENLLFAIEEIAPQSKVQVINCSDYLAGTPIDMASYLQIKFQEVVPAYAEEKITVCLGAILYINLHSALLNLCVSGELPCRLITVRPTYALSSKANNFEVVNFSSKKHDPEKIPIDDIEEDTLTQANIQNAEEFGIAGARTIKNIINMCVQLAQTPLPMLILGETGTGKSFLAKYIHFLANRPNDNFIEVNCASIPENLVESVLFGHKKGSFTGATSHQTGKFLQAHGGTLFLDEIGDMPLSIQAKILKVLENGYVDVLGSDKPVKVDVKIILATNKNLQEAIEEGTFRQDLYYRINVGEITLPPLRERPHDIHAITLKTIARVNAFFPAHKMLSNTAFEALKAREWAGNVRELQHVVERALFLSQKLILGEEDLFPEKTEENLPIHRVPWSCGVPIEQYLKATREYAFEEALALSKGNQSAAARLLGVSHQAISQYLKKKKDE